MVNSNANYARGEVVYALPMQTMGDRIRLLREARRYSQERLADTLGVTKGAVSQWENGGTENIKLVTFMALCAALMTDPEYLIFGPNRSPNETGPQAGAAKSRRLGQSS